MLVSHGRLLSIFASPADFDKSLDFDFKVDPEFADIDHPLYDVWTAKASSNATKHPGHTDIDHPL